MIILVLLLLLIITSIILSIYHILNPKKKPHTSPSPPDKYLLDLYNDETYDNNNIPNGGFLISMLNTHIICHNYSTNGNPNCDVNCTTTLDIGDINNLMKIIGQGIYNSSTGKYEGGAATNCLALDSTYFRSDLQPYAFGPLPYDDNPSHTGQYQDTVIGIIIDVKKIWKYIACMYTLDSGSIARFNKNRDIDSNFKSCDNSDKQCWNDYLNNDASKYLGFAGCGLLSSNENLRGLKNSANSFFVNPPSRKFKVPNENDILNNPIFAFNNNKNIPFSRYQWKDWINATKQVNKLTRTTRFIELQCNNGDGYRENEVDIIVPSNTNNFKIDSPCNVTEDFKKIWIDSIIGIFTNAKTNCSKSTTSISCLKCSGLCCCNEDYHINVVKQLVNTFNNNNKKKIHGFKLDTLNIDNLNPKNNNLNISLIN